MNCPLSRALPNDGGTSCTAPTAVAMKSATNRQALSDKRGRISRQKGSFAARMRALGILDPEMEEVDPLEVLERDSWTCQICFGPIDSQALWPDQWSPSMDHIIPVIRGGSHGIANLQASHLGCNISNVSISYAIGAILGGAFAPTIAQALIQSTGSSASVSLYLLGMTLLSVIAVLILRDRPGIDHSINNQAEQEVGATIFDKRREPAYENPSV